MHPEPHRAASECMLAKELGAKRSTAQKVMAARISSKAAEAAKQLTSVRSISMRSRGNSLDEWETVGRASRRDRQRQCPQPVPGAPGQRVWRSGLTMPSQRRPSSHPCEAPLLHSCASQVEVRIKKDSATATVGLSLQTPGEGDASPRGGASAPIITDVRPGILFETDEELKNGDRIIKVNGKTVTSEAEAKTEMAKTTSTLHLTVQRKSERRTSIRLRGMSSPRGRGRGGATATAITVVRHDVPPVYEETVGATNDNTNDDPEAADTPRGATQVAPTDTVGSTDDEEERLLAAEEEAFFRDEEEVAPPPEADYVVTMERV